MDQKANPNVRYKTVKGQQMKYHLDNAFRLLQTENPNMQILSMVKIELDFYIGLIPDQGPVAEFLTKELLELDETYNLILKEISADYDKGGYLEKTDCITAKMQNQYVYALKKYYICNNVYERFKLYEDDSIIDYKL